MLEDAHKERCYSKILESCVLGSRNEISELFLFATPKTLLNGVKAHTYIGNESRLIKDESDNYVYDDNNYVTWED